MGKRIDWAINVEVNYVPLPEGMEGNWHAGLHMLLNCLMKDLSLESEILLQEQRKYIGDELPMEKDAPNLFAYTG
jgi:hypothetical protein